MTRDADIERIAAVLDPAMQGYVAELPDIIATRLYDAGLVEPAGMDVERLARARHRWQHPSYPFAARNRCGCPAWAKEVRQMLVLYDEEAALLPTQASDSKEKP